MGLFSKIAEGLKKTKENISKKFYETFKGKLLDDEFYDNLEELLLTADVGALATEELIEELKDVAFKKKLTTPEEAKQVFFRLIKSKIDFEIAPYEYPLCILVAGVNGVGKTTAIGKLAHYFTKQGKSVLMAAGDTFRAAAGEQLQEWGDRSKVRVIKHEEGADAAAVVYDAIMRAKAKNIDVLLIDTAGRLHNKKNLMEELRKINRILEKEYPDAFRETLVVLDATTGQNALSQAKEFSEVAEITGIILTKMDGTAKGGIAVAIQSELGIPVKYIGVGESIDDLQKFDSEEFVNALFEVKES